MSNGHSVILLIYFKKQYNTSYSINQSIEILFLYEWKSEKIIETFILEQSISSDLSECSCNAGKLRINVPKNRYATTLPCKIFYLSYTFVNKEPRCNKQYNLTYILQNLFTIFLWLYKCHFRWSLSGNSVVHPKWIYQRQHYQGMC